MQIFVDASAVSLERTGEECCLALAKLLSVAKSLHKRAGCARFSWVEQPGSHSRPELIQKAYESKGVSGVSLSDREKRDMRALANELATGFVAGADPDVCHAASCNASLVWVLLKEVGAVVVQYDKDGVSREVVKVSNANHLKDDAVCRVLYCNHPDVFENSANKGYVSQSHGDKHFLVAEHAETWIKDTDVVISRYGAKVSKFRPGIVFDGDEYKALERSALKGAMCNGKYSLDRVARYVYTHDAVIGASEGEMTRKIRIETCNRDVHMYPVPETTPDN